MVRFIQVPPCSVLELFPAQQDQNDQERRTGDEQRHPRQDNRQSHRLTWSIRLNSYVDKPMLRC